MPERKTTVTYLEMTDPSDLAGGETDESRVPLSSAQLYRLVLSVPYGAVGREFYWVERTR